MFFNSSTTCSISLYLHVFCSCFYCRNVFSRTITKICFTTSVINFIAFTIYFTRRIRFTNTGINLQVLFTKLRFTSTSTVFLNTVLRFYCVIRIQICTVFISRVVESFKSGWNNKIWLNLQSLYFNCNQLIVLQQLVNI